MGRKSKRHRKGKASFHSPLSAHQKRGPKLVPPMRQLEGLHEVPWLRDVFPDMLWICSRLAPDPEARLLPTAKLLDTITEATAPHLPKESSPLVVITGTLTSFEGLPQQAREAVLQILVERDLYEDACPDDFAHSLGMYDAAPGSWLLAPWKQRGHTIDWERAQAHLRSLVTSAPDGRSALATAAKHLHFRAVVLADRIRFSREVTTVDLLSKFPHGLTEDERKRVDTFVRASFLAMLNLLEKPGAPSRLAWAQEFWRRNWSIYPCVAPHDPPTGDETSEARLGEIVPAYRERCTSLDEAFQGAATKADPDLYRPDRYEVLTGLIARLLRLLRGTVESPLLWNDEYGAPVIRSVIESKIVFRWLLAKEDAELYSKYKDYGRGHLKLLALHFREYLDSMDDPPEGMRKYVDQLNSAVNDEISEEFQDISIDKSFAGKSMRDMAIEAGLKRDYDLLYSPASAAFHGEWTALDRYALERCGNPLHLWHRVPRRQGAFLLGPHLAEFLIGEVSELVSLYMAKIAARA